MEALSVCAQIGAALCKSSEKRRVQSVDFATQDHIRYYNSCRSKSRRSCSAVHALSDDALNEQLENAVLEKLLRKKSLKKQAKMKMKMAKKMKDSSSSESSSSSDEECTNVVTNVPKRKKIFTIQGIEGMVKPVVSSAASCMVEVCSGGKCKKNGSAQVLAALQAGNAGVTSCKCMGQCDRGPNVRVRRDVGSIVYNGVSPGDATTLIQHHVSRNAAVPML